MLSASMSLLKMQMVHHAHVWAALNCTVSKTRHCLYFPGHIGGLAAVLAVILVEQRQLVIGICSHDACKHVLIQLQVSSMNGAQRTLRT